MDSILLYSYIINDIEPVYRFQSLFYWILFSYFCMVHSLYLSFRVSILILLDSILLYMQMLGMLQKILSVSILILLDSILLLLCSCCPPAYYSCFNPYSIGFYSLIENLMKLKKEQKKVSILILLDSILLSLKKGTILLSKYGFNPYSIGFYSLIRST